MKQHYKKQEKLESQYGVTVVSPNDNKILAVPKNLPPSEANKYQGNAVISAKSFETSSSDYNPKGQFNLWDLSANEKAELLRKYHSLPP